MKLRYIFSFALGAILFSGTIAWAAVFPVATGGTGVSTISSGQLVEGVGTSPIITVSTTSVTCSGSTSCSAFTVIGSSPITITSSGGGGGTGNVATSTHEVSGQVATFSSNSATPATIAGNTNFTFVSPLLSVVQASTSLLDVFKIINVGPSATTTIVGNATSTFGGGINLSNGGCFAIGGGCLTAGAIGGGSTEAANWATIAVLSGTPTYANGSSGVGATLTEVGTGALSVDSNNPAVGDRVLIKNQASACQNGIYSVTVAGSGIASYVLTRSTDYNTPTEITPGINTYVISGTTNSDSTWAVSFTPPLVISCSGGSNLNYSESAAGGTVTSVAASVPAFLSIAGSPITTSGTLAISYSGTALPTANGGTNATSFTANNLLYASSAGTTLVNTGSATTTTAVIGDILALSQIGGTSITYASTTQLTSGGTLASPTFYIDASGNVTSKDVATGYSGINSPVNRLTLSTATTTTWTGSTSLAYVPTVVAPFAGTIKDTRCLASTTKSFLGISVYVNGTVITPSYFVASNTIGVITFTGGNTFTVGQQISLYAGTTTTDANAISASCTFDVVQTT